MLVVQPRFEEIEDDIGVVEQAQIHTFHPVVPGVFIGSLIGEESDHPLTNNDTEIDLSVTQRNDYSYTLTFLARQESISNAAVDGSVYGYITVGELHEDDGSREAFTDLGTLTFDQTNGNNGSVDSTDDIISLWRTPVTDSLAANVFWATTGQGGVNDPIGEDDGDDSSGYTLDADTGAFTVQTNDPNQTVSGWFAHGGKLLLARDVETAQTENEHSIAMGVKLGTSNPTIDGSQYRVLAIFKRYGEQGESAIARLNQGFLTVNGSAIALAVDETSREVSNDSAPRSRRTIRPTRPRAR